MNSLRQKSKIFATSLINEGGKGERGPSGTPAPTENYDTCRMYRRDWPPDSPPMMLTSTKNGTRAVGDAGPYEVFCDVCFAAGASPRPTIYNARHLKHRRGVSHPMNEAFRQP